MNKELHIFIGNRRRLTKNHGDGSIATESNKPERRRKSPHFLVMADKKIEWKLIVSVLKDLFPEERESPDSLLLMLKMILLGEWYMLTDIQVENVCLKKGPYRCFLKIDMDATVPDWLTLAQFRKRFFSEHGAKKLLNSINSHLAQYDL